MVRVQGNAVGRCSADLCMCAYIWVMCCCATPPSACYTAQAPARSRGPDSCQHAIAMALHRPCCSTPLTQQLGSRQSWQLCHCDGAVLRIGRRPDRTYKQANVHAVGGAAASKAARSDQKQAPQAAPADARKIQAATCFLKGAPCAETVNLLASERACVLLWARLVYAAHAAGRQGAKRLDRGWGDVL